MQISCEVIGQLISVRFIESTIPLLPISEISSLQPSRLCGCSARLMSDIVGHPEDRFCRNASDFINGCFNELVAVFEPLRDKMN